MVVRGGSYGRYVPSGPGAPLRDAPEGGHLIYLQQGTLFAVRFDLTRLEAVGQAMPVLEGVAASPFYGSAQLAVSSEGTLVYVPGTVATPARPVDWLTRDGTTAVLRAANADWANPRFSPDGQKLAVDISDGTQRDIWVYEWARETLTQLTFDAGQDRFPVWTPDGRRLVFASDRAKASTHNLYWMNADGTGEITRLTDSPDDQRTWSWHPSGRFLVFRAIRPGAARPRRPMAHLLDRQRLSAVVGHGARAAVFESIQDPGRAVRRRRRLVPRRHAAGLVADEHSGWERPQQPVRSASGRHAVAAAAALKQASGVQDHVVFVFNCGDYLRTIAPGTK